MKIRNLVRKELIKKIPVKNVQVRRAINVKVYRNRKTGQAIVMLPKKIIKKIPKEVRVTW